jgi:adenosylcobinamide-phosphate synthase
MNTALVLALALVLDALMGEPRWLWSRIPHPAVLMGRLIEAADQHLNKAPYRRPKGMLVLLALVGGGILLGRLLEDVLPWPAEVLVAAILLAQRSLAEHVAAVATALRQGLPQGRTAVSMIVGRDVSALDDEGVARAAIESAAENLSDGVVAPAFWLLVGGLPGLLVYKLINTADSTIGYRTPRHELFGWAAARADDLLNLIPARLTAILIALVGGGRRAWHVARRDARLHRSPNAGWPEAAMAASLGVKLAGPRVYHGRRSNDPFVHAEGARRADSSAIALAVTLLWRVWGVLTVGAFLLSIAL